MREPIGYAAEDMAPNGMGFQVGIVHIEVQPVKPVCYAHA